MYLLYVDESGDPGPTGREEFLILSGLVVHESHWAECFRMVKELRNALRDEFGILRNQELHASNNIAGRGAVWGKRRSVEERVRLFQLVLETAAQMPGSRCINVCVRKSAPQFSTAKGRSVYQTAWTFLLQRFHNYIGQASVQGSAEAGIVLHDSGHESEVRKLLRKLRVYNPVPSKYGPPRNLPLLRLIEDPVPRQSYHAQFVQICDYISYALLLRREAPVPKYPGLSQVFDTLRPILLHEASKDDPDGVVRFPKT
jgi:hypothetical protein